MHLVKQPSLARSMEEAATCAVTSAAAGSQPAQTIPAAEVQSAKGSGRGGGRRRIVRPRIDIDDQIREANRVQDLLKKMGQAAKTLKKSQTKAKQRLIKKASRLSPQDLERIAVLKRVFDGGESETSDQASSVPDSPLVAPASAPAKGVSDLHSTLKDMMKGVAGAEDVVEGLGASYMQQAKRSVALSSSAGSEEELSRDESARNAKAPRRLSSLRRLPSAPRPDVLTEAVMTDDFSSGRD